MDAVFCVFNILSTCTGRTGTVVKSGVGSSSARAVAVVQTSPKGNALGAVSSAANAGSARRYQKST